MEVEPASAAQLLRLAAGPSPGTDRMWRDQEAAIAALGSLGLRECKSLVIWKYYQSFDMAKRLMVLRERVDSRRKGGGEERIELAELVEFPASVVSGLVAGRDTLSGSRLAPIESIDCLIGRNSSLGGQCANVLCVPEGAEELQSILEFVVLNEMCADQSDRRWREWCAKEVFSLSCAIDSLGPTLDDARRARLVDRYVSLFVFCRSASVRFYVTGLPLQGGTMGKRTVESFSRALACYGDALADESTPPSVKCTIVDELARTMEYCPVPRLVTEAKELLMKLRPDSEAMTPAEWREWAPATMMPEETREAKELMEELRKWKR